MAFFYVEVEAMDGIGKFIVFDFVGENVGFVLLL